MRKIKPTIHSIKVVIAFIFVFLFLLNSIKFLQNPFYLPCVYISGILFFLFAPFVSRRTPKGNETFWHALGFREYIKTAEKYRAQFFEEENIFEKYLPYAISFGLTEKWTKAFEEICKKPPKWYETKYSTTFSTSRLSSSINSSMVIFFTSILTSKTESKHTFLNSRGLGGGRSW